MRTCESADDGTVVPSPEDSRRFGVRVARAGQLDAAQLPDCLRWCAREGVDLLIARCPTDDHASVHALQSRGFQLMDCLVHYRRDLLDIPQPPDLQATVIRRGTAEDAADVEAIATRCFADYRGHYHVDPRLDPSAATAVYASWARSSATSVDPGTVLLVAESEGQVIGFLVLAVRDGIGVATLAGVLPEHRSRRLLQAMSLARLHLTAQMGATEARSSYLLTNVPVQQGAIATGFRIFRSEYTFHRWFDREPPAAGSRR